MATSYMTLGDGIKSRRNGERFRGQGRASSGRGRGSGRSFTSGRILGPIRRGPLSQNTWAPAYAISKPMLRTKKFPWQHDLFEDSLRASGISGVQVGTKLFISNLGHGVTNEDIRELFSEFGELKRYGMHYDKNGCPSGSAEVVYVRRSDAFQALKRYNNVLLDGKPMKIEIVNADIPVSARAKADIPVTVRVNVTGVDGRRKRTVPLNPESSSARVSAAANHGSRWNIRRGQWRGHSRGRGRGRARGYTRNQGLRGKSRSVEKAADQLDKELENYHAEAMQTS